MQTLGIVNTYDRIKVLDAHYRAIARQPRFARYLVLALPFLIFLLIWKKMNL